MLLFATSDKGGTGRSVTSSNVIYRCALHGADVGYVDFDFGSPTAGSVFGVSSLDRGTTTGHGTHAYLHDRSSSAQMVDVWKNSDRDTLRQRPPGSGRLMLFPGDAGGSEFAIDPGIVRRCIELFLLAEEQFEVTIVDLSAGRSFATQLVIEATSAPELTGVTSRWLVFHRWTRQHIIAAAALVYGDQGLLRIAADNGRDVEKFIDDLRFVRTAFVDPGSTETGGSLRPPQVAWLSQTNRELQQLASGLRIGRTATLGSVPLDPVLQWREQLITDADVAAQHIANSATVEAFERLAKLVMDPDAWVPL